MKTNKLLIMGMALAAVMGLGSCAESDDFVVNEPQNADGGKAVTINVVDNGYGDVTRAAESNDEEVQGENTIMQTNFIAGDKIGVFSISAGGAVHYNNLELRYNGTEWVNPDGKTFYYFTGMRYYAYYPYNPDIDPEKDVDWSAEGVDEFFAPYVTAWQPQADQSTTVKYSASDLMVGAGAMSGETFTFSMGHAMGLVFISVAEELNGTVYLFPKLTESEAITNFDEETTKLFSFEQGVYKPSQKQGYYRYIVKPGKPGGTSISGMNPDGRVFNFTCDNVSAGHYKKFIVDGGFDPSKSTVEDFTVELGDILFNDMHIEHQPETAARLSNYSSALGIISYLAEIDDEYTEGEKYVHGLVLDKDHNNSQGFWSNSSSSTSPDYGDMPGCPNDTTLRQCLADKSGLTNSKGIGTLTSGGACTRLQTAPKALAACSTWFMPSAGQWIKILCAFGAQITSGLDEATITFSYPNATSSSNFKTYAKTLWTSVSQSDSYNPGNTGYSFFVSSEKMEHTSWRVNFNYGYSSYAPKMQAYNKYNGGGAESTYRLYGCAF